MNHKIITTLLLAGLMSQSLAQNYQSVNSSRIAAFADETQHIHFLRIDSVSFQNDSILMAFPGFEEIIPGMCYIIDGASWIARKIIVRNNGWNFFINVRNDTVAINAGAGNGDSWTAYEKPGEIIITATVSSHDTLSFLGLQDSVKTITFQAFNTQMQAITHQVNNMSIAISKQHGFVRTLNFSLFPDIFTTVGLYGDGLREYNLAGLTDPQTGVQNLSWLEVHDFQPGDEIHVLFDSYQAVGATTEITKSIFKYLAREDFPDSVRYTIKRDMSVFFEDWNGSHSELIFDTITETFTAHTDFDLLPGEIQMDEEWEGAFFYRMDTSWHQAKVQPSVEQWLFPYGDECWNYYVFTGCLGDHFWYKGLGGPYHYCNIGMWKIIRSLEYYKKGNEEWGIPLIINAAANETSATGIQVSPNPVSDYLNIFSSPALLPYSLVFFDTGGRQLENHIISETQATINLSHLMHGLHFYTAQNQEAFIGSGKILVIK
jgi:hypothetical protein